ncbi:MAG: hypothetical protein U0520_03340 [Candidatus Saccharimonadales bacterium]
MDTHNPFGVDGHPREQAEEAASCQVIQLRPEQSKPPLSQSVKELAHWSIRFALLLPGELAQTAAETPVSTKAGRAARAIIAKSLGAIGTFTGTFAELIGEPPARNTSPGE